MKKKLVAISLLLTFMVVIIHEIIPHLHNEIDGSELLLNQNLSENQKSDKDSETDHRLPMHGHQNISADESFDFRRAGNGQERNDDLILTIAGIIPISLRDLYDPDLIKILTFFKSTEPEYPDSFIIHINTTRGSPFVA